ncbi:MAG: SCP2 sterol-binding domain-containing protein [Pseudomonadota bacterium]|uniref:Ubiquinone biosynthesis accessory factor UbiT n=1 Tax=Rheinheimera nanhaiensis E407-8 TaxID=562729 RepID=I1DV85_9GAMM|nr:SCP2 sterol-binding domain-containing protein [Rheinheimera nanhaiensis]GAB57963.1 SCP-2 sterol transfer family protein [Rheinheimera nanhaiensis E407-8]
MFDIKSVNSKLVASLPTMLRGLTRCAPKAAQAGVLQLALNQFFRPELNASELDFLSGKTLVVQVSDIALQFAISLNGDKLRVQLASAGQDLLLKAELADFVAMISNTADPDTLFFRRRLQMLGDTELGLYCKNLLDSIGPERLPKLCQLGLSWLAQQQLIASDNAAALVN